MLIVCPSCGTSYDVGLASLQPNGRRVRCVRCRAVWHAEASHADKLMAAAEELAPVRRTVAAMAEVMSGDLAAASAAFATESLAGGVIDGAADRAGPIGTAAAAPPADHFEESEFDGQADHPGHQPDAPEGDFDASDAAEASPFLDQPPDDAAVEVEAPPLAPMAAEEDRAPIEIDADPVEPAGEPSEDIETYAARRQRPAARQAWHWPLSHLQSGILVLLILDGILIGWRTDLVRLLPQTASFYSMLGLPVNLRGLSFDGVTTVAEQHEAVPILLVGGTIVNTSGRLVDVPRLKFAVRNAANEEIYSWTAVPPRPSLAPGEAVSFRSRLASPPPDAHDVLVRFITRQDIIGGAH
jgi:predicted Zn finger-like uncharacterized protein